MKPTRLRTRQTGTISTSVAKKVSGVVVDEANQTDTISCPEDLQNPGYVMVKGGVTQNMGNYSSVSVGISVSMPCRAVATEIEKTYQECSATVDRLIEEELKKATGASDLPVV